MREFNEAIKYDNARPISLSDIKFIDIPNYKNIPGCDPKAAVIKYNGVNARVSSRILLIGVDEEGNYKVCVNNNKYYLELPGGSLDENESPKEAAVRELREETGINVSLNDVKETNNNYYYISGNKWFTYNDTGVAKEDWWPGSYNFLFIALINDTPQTTGSEKFIWMDIIDLLNDWRCKRQWADALIEFKNSIKNKEDEVHMDDTIDSKDFHDELNDQMLNSASKADKNLVSDTLLSNYVGDIDILYDNVKNEHIKRSYRGKDSNDPVQHVCFTRSLYNPSTVLNYKWAFGMVVRREIIEEQYPLIPYNDLFKRLTNTKGSTKVNIKSLQEGQDGKYRLILQRYSPREISKEIFEEIKAQVLKNPNYGVGTKNALWTGYNNGKFRCYYGYFKDDDFGGPKVVASGYQTSNSDIVLSMETVRELCLNQYLEYEERVYPKEEYLKVGTPVQILIPKWISYKKEEGHGTKHGNWSGVYAEQAWNNDNFECPINFKERYSILQYLKELKNICATKNIEVIFYQPNYN